MKNDLIARAKELFRDEGQVNGEDAHEIPIDLRRAKVTQVKKLLETQYVEFTHPCLSLHTY